MKGDNSVCQTSLLDNTLAHRIAQASRSFPADDSPLLDKSINLVTRSLPLSSELIVARSKGARQIRDSQRSKMYLVCHCKFWVERVDITGSMRYTSLGRKRTSISKESLDVYLEFYIP
jgi:hypothetical protein